MLYSCCHEIDCLDRRCYAHGSLQNGFTPDACHAKHDFVVLAPFRGCCWQPRCIRAFPLCTPNSAFTPGFETIQNRATLPEGPAICRPCRIFPWWIQGLAAHYLMWRLFLFRQMPEDRARLAALLLSPLKYKTKTFLNTS